MDILFEWLSASLRWLHVMAGIAWVGTSFYFNWFDSLVRPSSNPVLRPNPRGTMEEIHGGSFYYHEQYWPDQHPTNLMRHSWPAKTTFVTGIFLLATIYWVGASSYLVDKSVLNITADTAITISAFSIVLCWGIYRTLCRATDDNRIILCVMALVVLFACWGYMQVFGARAAFLHVGAMMGAMMGLNVWLVIVPNHIAMTRQLSQGDKLNLHHGFLAKKVSQHNNYFSIPVVFCMLSNHFSFIYGHPLAWLILFCLLTAGWGIRHGFNLHYKTGEDPGWVKALVLLAFALAVGLSFIPRPAAAVTAEKLTDAKALAIIQQRCAGCHAAQPTQSGFVAPPLGLMLESLDQVVVAKAKIHQRMSVARDMPLANLTQMSEEERTLVTQWLAAK